MDNTINGRTPEEIKKGLKKCPNRDCSLCLSSFHCDLEADALAYIQQLERERDAAVEQLTETSNEIGSCKGCVHYTNPGYKCYLWEANENCYEWRGVQEVQHGTE